MANENSQNQQICAISRNRKTYCRLDLLNDNLVKVSSLEGQVISGSVTIKNELESSLERRNGSLELLLSKDLSTDYFKLTVINKVQVFVIVIDMISNISAEYNLGIFLMDNIDISVVPSGDNKLSLDLLDIINLYNGTFSGELANEIIIDEGANMSEAILSIVQSKVLMNWSKKKIESTTLTVPHDVNVEQGGTVADLLNELIELYLNYSCYFDENGYFVYEKLKNRLTDVIIQEFINSDLILQYDSYKKSFSNIKNTVTVLGKIEETSEDVTTPYQYTYTTTLPDNHPSSVKKLNGQVLLKVITNDDAQSTEACKSESEYNIAKYNNMGEQISMTILPDYRLLPNRVVILEQTNNKDFEIPNSKWLINSIQINLGEETMSLDLSRLYS